MGDDNNIPTMSDTHGDDPRRVVEVVNNIKDFVRRRIGNQDKGWVQAPEDLEFEVDEWTLHHLRENRFKRCGEFLYLIIQISKFSAEIEREIGGVIIIEDTHNMTKAKIKIINVGDRTSVFVKEFREPLDQKRVVIHFHTHVKPQSNLPFANLLPSFTDLRNSTRGTSDSIDYYMVSDPKGFCIYQVFMNDFNVGEAEYEQGLISAYADCIEQHSWDAIFDYFKRFSISLRFYRL